MNTPTDPPWWQEAIEAVARQIYNANLSNGIDWWAGSVSEGARLTYRTRAEAAIRAALPFIADAKTGPECPHGVPGGLRLHRTTARPLCPQCRALNGICGNTVAGFGGDPLVCDLPVGHDGWHGCDNAHAAPMATATLTSTASRCHWTNVSPYVEREDVTDTIAAAEARGYARAVAVLRSQCLTFADSAADLLEAEATKETTDHA